MPRDPTGAPHTGTLGLFDDASEHAAATALATAHEIHRLKGQIRRLERRDRGAARRRTCEEGREGCEDGRERGRDGRDGKDGKDGKQKERGKEAWWRTLFGSSGGGGGRGGSREISYTDVRGGGDGGFGDGKFGSAEEADGKFGDGAGAGARDSRETTIQYKIVRRPATPEAEWTAEDVQSGDSIWLRECGMVRVKSACPGGCRIVSGRGVGRRGG